MAMPIGVNLMVSLAVKTAAIQTKPACAGSKTFDFPLVRAGGLSFCSRDFQPPGLKLTLMGNAVPLSIANFVSDLIRVPDQQVVTND